MGDAVVRIDYFSDILCIWAYIGQVRLDELRREMGDRIEVREWFVAVFGNVAKKMDDRWKKHGGRASWC